MSHKKDIQNPITTRTCESFQAKSGFVERTIAGETILVPVGNTTRVLNGMVLLNETGKFLWDKLQKPISEKALIDALLSEFEIDEETAKSDVKNFMQNGINNNLIYQI